MDLISTGRKVEDILARYHNLVEYEADNLKREFAIDSPGSMEKAIEDIQNQERLLQIGIVGRVKAGKSSLLNALLFNGENILPKAATPMTAALTQLSYGNELSSEVEFFTKEDFLKIKEAHGKYLSRLSNLKETALKNLKERKKKKEKGLLTIPSKLSPQEEKELNEKALRQALREIKNETELSAAYDQFEKMKNSGVDIDSLGELKKIKAENISDLSASLMEYVGSDGKYMPFTKSVDIKLPQENLKDIRIIDTPGINDPVQSREDRTRELLKYCDVTFVVSPSGQFISNEDTDLMDRITKKEGVSDVYVVASQVDTQLMGSEKEKYNGELPKVLDGIRSSLGTHLVSTLKKLKQSSPEVGAAFDELIEGGKDNVVHSSGICQTLKSQFEEKEKWDDGARHVWGYLTREYPDYFSDSDINLSCANLDLLGNISKINSIVSDVRSKKDEILNKRKQEFIEVKTRAFTQYLDAIISFAENQTEKIKNSDKEELKIQKDKLLKVQQKASSVLNEEYYDLVDELEINIKNTLTAKLNSFFRETRDSVKGEQGTESETYRVEKSGIGSWAARKLWGGGYETRTRTYTTLRSGAVRSALEDLTCDIENSISTESRQFVLDWRKSLYSNLLKTLRSTVSDDDLDTQLIKKTIRSVLNSVEYPEMDYGSLLDSGKEESKKKSNGMFWGGLFANISRSTGGLNARGTLTGSEAEEYLGQALEFIKSLKKQVDNDIKAYCKNLIQSLKKIDPSEKIFGNYKMRIEELEEQLKNRELTLEMFSKFTKELKEVC